MGQGPLRREARAENEWLAAGSSSVQQQALGDYDRAMAGFFNGSHRKPSWCKAGRDEGFCIRDVNVEKVNRRWGRVFGPKVGWLRFRPTRPLPSGDVGHGHGNAGGIGQVGDRFARASGLESVTAIHPVQAPAVRDQLETIHAMLGARDEP